ncbi:MAG TPA: hypothetical protein PKE55_09705 [Kiritimatiellia bacterium]|nr:hypothetical protein [Kiritimatiellia bacterium]
MNAEPSCILPSGNLTVQANVKSRERLRFILILLGMFLVLGTSCQTHRDLELAPDHPEVLHTLLETSGICPAGYDLIDVPNLRRAMGMKKNPGFITNTSELEAMSRFGGSDPFLVIYGTGQTICMMVNGVFFRDPSRIETFLQDLEQRRRLRIAVYEKPTDHGSWVMICAISPTRIYSEAERSAILDGLGRKQTNLNTRLRFNRLWENPP